MFTFRLFLAGVLLTATATLLTHAVFAAPPTAPAAAPATAPAATLPIATSAPLAVTEPDHGKTLKLGDATSAAISLSGNATTGYSWSVSKVEGDALQQVGEIQYVPLRAPAGMVGTGGTSVATFRAVKAGQTTITLAYARPWEKDTPPAKTFQVTLIVEKAPATAPATTTAPFKLMK